MLTHFAKHHMGSSPECHFTNQMRSNHPKQKSVLSMGQKGLREVHNERYMVSTSRDTGHAYNFLEMCKKPVRKKTKEQTQYTSKKERMAKDF